MITLYPAHERGHFNFGWLDTYHTFSFGEFFAPDKKGFRTLRVINDDIIQPGKGFETHSHRDMEIISYVLRGSLAHKDSMGNGSTIQAGDVQYMSAGSGVTHSEFSATTTDETRLIQIWIFPNAKGLTPRYDQKAFSTEARKNKLCLIASGTGENGSIAIHQDVHLYASLLDTGKKIQATAKTGRHFFLYVANGALKLDGATTLSQGDGAAISEQAKIDLQATENSEFLLFDLS